MENPRLVVESLYVTHERKVIKVRMQDCAVYKTCGECLGVRDRYCGKCPLENNCSLWIDFQDAAKDPATSYAAAVGARVTEAIICHSRRMKSRNMPSEIPSR